MSVFFGLDTEAYDRQYTDRELLARIVRYFAPHRRRILFVGVLVAVIALIGAAQPIVVSRGLDLLVASHLRSGDHRRHSARHRHSELDQQLVEATTHRPDHR
jgi:hypothetical protein